MCIWQEWRGKEARILSKLRTAIQGRWRNLSVKRRAALSIVFLVTAIYLSYNVWQHFNPPALIAEGSIEATQIIIRSETSGVVEQCLIAEGEQILPGQKLVVLDDSSSDLVTAQSMAHLEGLRAQLQELESGARQEQLGHSAAQVQQAEAMLSKAQANLTLQEKSFQRYQELYNAGGVSLQVLDQQRALMEQAQGDAQAFNAQLRGAQEQYKLLQSGASDTSIAALAARVKEAETAYRQSIEKGSKTVITSRTGGLVRQRLVEVGEYVMPNTAVAVLADTEHLWITGYLPTKHLSQVQLNQTVWIRVDAWPDQLFPGHIASIADHAEFTPLNKQTGSDRADLVFAIKILLQDSPKELLAGMPADILFKKP